MKIQKGFIQIPILIAIIVGVSVLSGAGYVGVKQYQNYQVEKMKKEKEAQEREKEVQMATEAQQKALETAQQEIEKLKIESEQSKTQQKVIEYKLNQQNAKPKDLSITSSELGPYLNLTYFLTLLS